MKPETSTLPDDEALRWKLINFMPRRLVGNDSRLEAFLSGSVDFTKPNDDEGQEWT